MWFESKRRGEKNGISEETASVERRRGNEGGRNGLGREAKKTVLHDGSDGPFCLFVITCGGRQKG